jgi:hypothetical protein
MPAMPTSCASSSTAASDGRTHASMRSNAPQVTVPTDVVRVYLEIGERSVFAVALDWPGWARRAKSDGDALEAFDAYRDRYRHAVSVPVPDGRLEVIGTVPGNRTTDFGAPDARGPWDEGRPDEGERARQVALLRDAWATFDGVVASAPSALRKGPRGGGRDRAKVVAHVIEAERAYCPKIGTRTPPRTPWAEQREIVASALLAAVPGTSWPVGYAVRRFAWHVLDHAWEIEDKSR